MDGIACEMLKAGGATVIDWFTRVANVCMTERKVPRDCQRAVIVSLYKGKGVIEECKNYRGISLLSIPGKLYGKVMINRVREQTNGAMEEKQSGFREGRGCADQIFTVRCLSEKYLEKHNYVYVAFLDLEKAYDRVDREVL